MKLNHVQSAVLLGLLTWPAMHFGQDSFGGPRTTPAPATPPAQGPVPRSTAPTQQPGRAAPAPPRPQSAPTNADAAELQDHGVAPPAQLHAGAMHGPTPNRLPGGKVVTTAALSKLLQDRGSGAVVFDVLGGAETLPNALRAQWLAQPGTFSDQVQQQLVQGLQTQTGGRRDTPLVFYCASTQCWMSYNAALRAVNAGYTNVMWYRGGIEAWKAAGLPTSR